MANQIIEIQKRLQRKYENPNENVIATTFLGHPRSMSDQSFDLRFSVPLVPQQTGMSCWAAGAAMIVAWREKICIDPKEIAKAAGKLASYVNNEGLLADDPSIFPVWGLTPEPQQSYTVEGFRQLLEMYGPLWVAGSVTTPHIRVVTGIYGDGTPDGTRVLINDPWQRGMTTFSLPNTGAQYEETYPQFVAETERLAGREAARFPNAIYVARSTKPLFGSPISQSLGKLVRMNGIRPTYSVVPNILSRSQSLPVDFDVPRLIPDIKKPSPMTCWAAASAILISYKEGAPVPVEEAVRRAGDHYEQLLRSDSPLSKAEVATYLSKLGLANEPIKEPSVDRVIQLLREFGAIWLTPDYDTAFSLDARIVSGIHGDGMPSGTNIVLHDPSNGTKAVVVFNRLYDVFERQGLSNQTGQLIAIYWPPDTLGAVVSQDTHLGETTTVRNGKENILTNFSITHSYNYICPSNTVTQQSEYSFAQNPAAAVIAGMTIPDAASIGLAAIAIVQAQVSASQGSFALSYDKAQRLLTPEARAQMPGSQITKKKYSEHLLNLGIGAINAANADVIIEWEGNPYGEIGTPIIRRSLETSTEWTKSSANITITKVDRIPLPQTDPRSWPIVYSYEGTYDPYGNGYFEFSGEFEINAFGCLKFNRHQVLSRSIADWAIGGTPENKVQRGQDVIVSIPAIPQEQIDYLRTKLPG